MTRYMRAVLLAAVGGLAAVGCTGSRPGAQARYQDYADGYWPDRYKPASREAVLHPHETQVRNALIADATIGNYMFESGTDVLTDNGKQKLDYLARRGMCADGHLYLQTARDLTYDAKNPTELVAKRGELDAKRGQAVLAYMSSQPGGKQYDITPLDPQDTRMTVVGPATAVRGLNAQYRSGITGQAGLPLTGIGGGPGAGAPAVPTSGTAGAGGGTTVNTAPPSSGPPGSSSGSGSSGGSGGR